MNEEHAIILATKWYDHKKLAELGETEGTFSIIAYSFRVFEIYAFQGLVYKKGPFSISEEQNIKDAIEQYRIVSAFSASSSTAQSVEPLQKHALTEHDIHKLIFTKHKGSTFWQDVGE